MKKIYRLEDLDCSNCAVKMETAISKIDGVANADVSFIAQKLTIDMDEEKADEIMKKVVKVCKKIEPDCKIIIK